MSFIFISENFILPRYLSIQVRLELPSFVLPLSIDVSHVATSQYHNISNLTVFAIFGPENSLSYTK